MLQEMLKIFHISFLSRRARLRRCVLVTLPSVFTLIFLMCRREIGTFETSPGHPQMSWIRIKSNQTQEDSGRYGQHTGLVRSAFPVHDTAPCTNCALYNLSAPTRSDFQCVPHLTVPRSVICVYPAKVDIYISKSIIDKGTWEPDSVNMVQRYMKGHPEMGLFDIGCNIGVYSLPVAAMGHKVVAVEPSMDHVLRVHKAAQLQHLESNIILLRNALSDVRGDAQLMMHPNNQGALEINQVQLTSEPIEEGSVAPLAVIKTIVMDDLLHVCNFSKAIMKIDIEGFEHRAFVEAAGLFDRIHIPAVMMEWAAMRQFHDRPQSDSDRMLVIRMIEFFKRRQYIPCSIRGRQLFLHQWDKWPRDIMWRYTDTFFI